MRGVRMAWGYRQGLGAVAASAQRLHTALEGPGLHAVQAQGADFRVRVCDASR